MPVKSTYVVTPGPTVASVLKAPPLIDCSITMLVAFVALFCQLSVMVGPKVRAAVRLDGALGGFKTITTGVVDFTVMLGNSAP